MLKSGEKLRKLLILLATWGLLLAFFIAYERYFVMGQREFLKEDGFRALSVVLRTGWHLPVWLWWAAGWPLLPLPQAPLQLQVSSQASKHSESFRSGRSPPSSRAGDSRS
jgi:hypothetical protein